LQWPRGDERPHFQKYVLVAKLPEAGGPKRTGGGTRPMCGPAGASSGVSIEARHQRGGVGAVARRRAADPKRLKPTAERR